MFKDFPRNFLIDFSRISSIAFCLHAIWGVFRESFKKFTRNSFNDITGDSSSDFCHFFSNFPSAFFFFEILCKYFWFYSRILAYISSTILFGMLPDFFPRDFSLNSYSKLFQIFLTEFSPTTFFWIIQRIISGALSNISSRVLKIFHGFLLEFLDNCLGSTSETLLISSCFF